MALRLTTSDFIRKSKILYSDLCYENTRYINKVTHVELFCKIHSHTYMQRPCDHYVYRGCSFCLSDRRSIKFDEWYERSVASNGDMDYFFGDVDKVGFSISNQVKIKCNNHGDFYVNAKAFMYGRSNCLHCVKKYRKSRDEIIGECIEAHGYTFDYSLVDVNCRMKDKIPIVCEDHGLFHQVAYDHIRSEYGCKECASEVKGWRRSDWINMSKGRECLLYVIRCFSDKESFYKIGITSRSLAHRYKTKLSMPYEFEVLKIITGEAGDVWDKESEVLKMFRDYRYSPEIQFKGSVIECFDGIGDLIDEI